MVESPYIIRVAIALFMVASSIKGRSEIRNATPIRRAHPRFVENLRSLGVQVEWTTRNEDRRGPGAYFASAPQAEGLHAPGNCLSRSWTRSPIC